MSCDRSSSGEADASSRVSTPECNLRDEWRLAEVPFREYSGHTLDVVDLTWSPRNISGGRYLLSASLDKTVRLWHTSKKTVCLCVFAHPKCVTSVDFHPSTKQLRFVSGCFDSKVRIWDIESGSVVQWKQVQNRVTSCCFRPDGNIVCVGLMNGVVVFLHTDGLKFYTQVECRNRRGKHRKGRKVTGVVYSPTVIDKSSGAATLLVSTNDSRLRAFRTTDFAQVMKYKGLRNNSLQISASYSPDGSTIMSGSEDGRVVVWRAAHDWYNPGSATARITGYSKVKNNSYESFDSTEGKVCTATGFLPCVSSPIELAELSAARKLAAGTISRLEYNKVVQMLERDGMRLNLEAATGHAGVECKALAADLEKRAFHGIVTVDYEGQMKLFTHAVPAHSTDAAAKATAGESEVTEHKSRPQNGDAEKGDKEEDEELSAGESPVVPARSLNIIAAMSSPPALPPKPVAKTQKEKSTPPSMPPRPSSRISLINEE